MSTHAVESDSPVNVSVGTDSLSSDASVNTDASTPTPSNNETPGRTRMNIPSASHHATALAERRSQELAEQQAQYERDLIEQDNRTYAVQSQALEHVLNGDLSADGVTLSLDSPLHDELAQQLSEHGYSYTTSSVSSTVNGETESRNTVTVYPEANANVLDQFYRADDEYQSLTPFGESFLRRFNRWPRWFNL